MAVLTNETAVQAPILPPTLVWDINRFSKFLEKYNFDIPSGAVTDVINYIGMTENTSSNISDYADILRCFFVKNAEQEEIFSSCLFRFVFPDYQQHQADFNRQSLLLTQVQEDKVISEQYLKRLKREKNTLQKRLAEYENQLKQGAVAPAITAKEAQLLEKKLGKGKEDFDTLSKQSGKKLKDFIKDLPLDVSRYLPKDVDEIEKTLFDLLRKAIRRKHAKEVMAYITGLISSLKTVRKVIDSKGTLLEDCEATKERIQRLENDSKKEQQRLDQFIEQLPLLERDVEKLRPVMQHRDEFLADYHNRSVRSEFSGELDVPDKPFNQLSEKEKRAIQMYIRENAQQFRTRLTHNIYTIRRKRLEISETCKKACGTNGIPLKLVYEKPVPRKTKLVLFLDVSGSCKEASELMLNFMYYMQEVFPGGCKLYAFVDNLYDISAMMRVPNCEMAIKKVLDEIPRRGVYSNYERPFREFWESSAHEITKDTLVFFIGDARNNRNDSGEEFVKAISRKARKAYWMNTDIKEKWNQGDSIIAKYMPYMANSEETRTPLTLLRFLLSVR